MENRIDYEWCAYDSCDNAEILWTRYANNSNQTGIMRTRTRRCASFSCDQDNLCPSTGCCNGCVAQEAQIKRDTLRELYDKYEGVITVGGPKSKVGAFMPFFFTASRGSDQHIRLPNTVQTPSLAWKRVRRICVFELV